MQELAFDLKMKAAQSPPFTAKVYIRTVYFKSTFMLPMYIILRR